MAIIKIHQFSMGVTFKGTPNSWVSTGDTGTWMNSTLASIPESVEMAISAGLFEIAEGRSSNTSALIGREVKDQSNSDTWSVLAVANRIQDNFGRDFSGYRYFLTRGLGRLPDLVNWYIKVVNRPVYNPFDSNKIGYPATYDDAWTQSQIFPKFDRFIGSRIIPYNEPCVELIVDYLARKQCSEIAWAYRVEGLEKPEYFQVIYPASAEAEDIIKFQLNRHPTQKQIVGNQSQIAATFNTLVNQGYVQTSHIEDITKALNNLDFTPQIWEEEIFKKFNIENISNLDILARWYFLRGLILPEKLPNFIEWLSHTKWNRKSLDKLNRTIEAFSKSITNVSQRNVFQDNLREGIDYLIVKLSNKNQSINMTLWLLKNSSGIYGKEFKQMSYADEIHGDLKIIFKIKNKITQKVISFYSNQNLQRDEVLANLKEYIEDLQKHNISIEEFKYDHYSKEFLILGQKSWEPITRAICEIIWFESNTSLPVKTGNHILCDLKPLGDFFAKIDNSQFSSRVSALFYQLSQGKVPEDVWSRCQFVQDNVLPNSGDKNTKDRAFLYGLKVDRDIGNIERSQRFAMKISTWGFRQLAKPIPKTPTYFQSLIAFALVFWLGSIFKPFSNLSLPNLINFGSKNPEQEFIKTVNALTSMEKELSDKFPPSSLPKPTVKPKQIVQAEIVKIIDSEGNHNLDFANKTRSSQQWKKSVKQYQEKLRQEYNYKMIEATGNFETGDNTDKALRCAIGKRLNITLDDICTETFDDYISKIVSKSDWDTTKKSIEQLRNEFVKNHQLDILKVEQAISKALIIPQGEAFLKDDSLWMKQIDKLQSSYNLYSIPKGVIYPPNSKPISANEMNSSDRSNVNNKNPDTYDILKCSVAKELNKKLKEKPTICQPISEFKDI